MKFLTLLVIFFSMIAVLTIPAYTKRNLYRPPKLHVGDNRMRCEYYDEVEYDPDETEKQVAALNASSDDWILDVACRTGHLVGALNPDNAVGVDASSEMVAHARALYPDHLFRTGNVLKRSLFPAEQFTQIGCFGNAVYSFPLKLVLIQNCYYWLKNNGHFLIQLNGLKKQTRARIVYDDANHFEKDDKVYPEQTSTILSIVEGVGFKLVEQSLMKDGSVLYVFSKFFTF